MNTIPSWDKKTQTRGTMFPAKHYCSKYIVIWPIDNCLTFHQFNEYSKRVARSHYGTQINCTLSVMTGLPRPTKKSSRPWWSSWPDCWYVRQAHSVWASMSWFNHQWCLGSPVTTVLKLYVCFERMWKKAVEMLFSMMWWVSSAI